MTSPDTLSGHAAGYPRLVADIGGSNARFGWIDLPGADVAHVRKLPVPGYDSPAGAVRAYLAELAPVLGTAFRSPRQAALAVATPVEGDQIRFTNSHWSFSRRGLQHELGLAGLQVLNDFEALALALPHLKPAQLRAHGALPRADGGVLAVVGPGTGLGVGGVVRTRAGWQALPGEGGHSTLAAGDDFEAEVLRAARAQHGHVSAERLLSGIGLPTLHQAVAAALDRPTGVLSAEQVVEQGGDGADPLCARTLDTFCALLGSFAGNVALTLGARGGVFIGGGIVPRIAERFFASAFRERFEAKGRMRPYVESIPTALITDTLVALTGCAAGIEPVTVE